MNISVVKDLQYSVYNNKGFNICIGLTPSQLPVLHGLTTLEADRMFICLSSRDPPVVFVLLTNVKTRRGDKVLWTFVENIIVWDFFL